MKQNPNLRSKNSNIEINIGSLVYKIMVRKYVFLFSVLICGFIAFAFIKITPPIFEASTTLLIDASGKNRSFGESQSVEGGIGLIDIEKNLNNEINIISSFNLIKQALNGLDFEVTYYSKSFYNTREHYHEFPFNVEVTSNKTQVYNTPIFIEILDDNKFKLSISTNEFYIANAADESPRQIKKKLDYTGTYEFNEPIVNNYFNFIINKSETEISTESFSNRKLFFTITSIDNLTKDYFNKLEATQQDINGTILKLTSTGEIVDKEVDFLTRLTDEYKKSNLRAREEIAGSKEDFIRNQLRNVADSLAIAEQNVENFKSNKQAVDLSTTASSSLNRAAELNTEKAKIELNIKYLDGLLEYFENAKSTDELLVPSTEGIDDAVLSENIIELKQLSAQKARKKMYVTESNQELILLNRQIEFAIESIKESIKNSIQSSKLALNELTARISTVQGIINVLPNREKQLLVMTRKKILYENLFNYLSQELAETGIARADNIQDIRVLDDPRMEGSSAIYPKKLIIYILAIFVGFVFPLAWVIYFDDSEEPIRDRQQIEKYSNLPVLASIAHGNKASASSSDTELSQWQVEESFRDLGANLQYITKNKSGLAIGVSSTVPNEGKTFCAVKLSVTLAKSNKKVLLIDTDFRNSKILDKEYNIKTDLADYITLNGTPVNSIIQKHKKIPNFSFIQTGISESNPQQLLTSSKFNSLLHEVKDNYDYVIFDTPPLGLVSDYLLLSNFIDVHLFVLRRKTSRLSFIDNIINKINTNELKNTFLIYNDEKSKSFKYGYSNYQTRRSRRKS